jgi:hypothetical protein
VKGGGSFSIETFLLSVARSTQSTGLVFWEIENFSHGLMERIGCCWGVVKELGLVFCLAQVLGSKIFPWRTHLYCNQTTPQ